MCSIAVNVNSTWAIFLVRVVGGTVAFTVTLQGLVDAVAVVANKVREVTVCKLDGYTYDLILLDYNIIEENNPLSRLVPY